MTFDNQIEHLKTRYTITNVIELDHWHTLPYELAQRWMRDTLSKIWKTEFANNERIIFVHRSDCYLPTRQLGLILENLQIAINKQDISNFFVIVLSNNLAINEQINLLNKISFDPVPVTGIYCNDTDHNIINLDKHPSGEKEIYHYGSPEPLKVSLNSLTQREQFLLKDSKTFCIYPWIHLHAYPTGEAYPCCHAEMHPGKIGNCRENTLAEIYNSLQQRKLRLDMLSETPNAACTRCYEQEESGFFSGRQSANKHHGHHIDRVAETLEDGTHERFEMTYWDIRFSNLCNLSCRSCGHIFSSSWYQDQVALAGLEWKKTHKVLNYAGRTETDIWEQLVPHLDYVDQIYFAGGEPLMMEEHYNILDELERRNRFDVRLAYNTNFTHTKLKERTVFNYWKKFKEISVGASLDAMGPRAEYIRKGTNWDTVERNREEMLEICPDVDFYISSTLSIMNVLHLPQFHREWVEKGYIKPQDFNVNVLQDPAHYRIDIATPEYKQRILEAYQEHIEWLKPLDPLKRATVGFESAINYMMATDNSNLLPKFWDKTVQLDEIRKENILDVIPELKDLK